MPQVPVSNVQAPIAVCGVDPDTGDAYSLGLAIPTTISTAGTTTIEVGQGAFFGFNVLGTGTTFVANAYDILGTLTTTLQSLAVTALGPVGPGPGSMGVRYGGSLVIVTTGTAGALNVLWD